MKRTPKKFVDNFSTVRPTLTHEERVFRDAFVRSYIQDFNGKNAAIRIGIPALLASAKAAVLLREVYVRVKLMDTVRTLQPSDVVTRGQVMAHMWHLANNAWDDSAKVAATAHVAKMLGMDRAEEKTSEAPANVMFVPVMSIQDWQATALTAQQVLKRDASVAVHLPS